MIGHLVSAALWAVLASLLLSVVLGAAVSGLIHVSRPAAATRQALWSVALGAAGLAPVVILAVMLVRGALGAGADDMPAPASHAERSRGTAPAAAIVAVPRQARDDSAARAVPAAPAVRSGMSLRVPAPPDVTPLVAEGIVIVWALGALGGLAGLGRSLMRVRGLKLRSSALDGDLATELPWLTTMPGREIYLRLSYETETPIAVGFRRPVILIPTEMATAAGLTSIEPLVMHEYAHLARYDDWTNLIQRAIERVFWFNPLVWILGRRLALEREVAADEAVVARTHDAKNYATALWRMAQEMRMPEHVVVAPGAMLTRKQITVRIERILEDAPVAGRRFGAAAFALVALAITGVAGVAATAPPMTLAQDTPMPAENAATPLATITPAPRRATRIVHAAPHPAAWAAAHPVAHATAQASAHVATLAVRPPAPPVAPATLAPRVSPASPLSPDPAEITDQVMSDPDIARLKDLGKQISTDVQRRLADQARQGAEQHRQVAEQHRRGADDGEQPPAGPLTRELVASCNACDFSGRDLHGINLSALSLSGDDFSHANLDGANLGHTTLRGVEFSHASLRGAQFTEAKLTGVDLNHATLDGANFTNALLTGVDLSHASMTGTITTGMHLIGSSLP